MRNEGKAGSPPRDLRERTADYALAIIGIARAVNRDDVGQVLGRQLLRSGTSVGAQYREACRARSTAEFISKLELAQQELEESAYWLELLERAGWKSSEQIVQARAETSELLAIFSASAKTAKRNRNE
jgi:four helix bundle protein